MDNLIDYYVSNIQTIYNRVTKLYGKIDTVFMDGMATDGLTIRPPTSKLLNRQTYLWSISVINDLQRVVDDLVGIANTYDLVDFVNGQEEIKTLRLWVPNQLMVDQDYVTKLADNFARVNRLLDQIATNYNRTFN